MRAETSKQVLVVDDEPSIRELVAESLREAGYRVDVAHNGAEALRQMRRRPPDAVVLDMMMPVLDGAGLRELMQLNPRYSGIPVLVVTAAFGAYQMAEQIGAQACLTKPFELDELVQTVDRLIGQRASRSAAEPPPQAGRRTNSSFAPS